MPRAVRKPLPSPALELLLPSVSAHPASPFPAPPSAPTVRPAESPCSIRATQHYPFPTSRSRVRTPATILRRTPAVFRLRLEEIARSALSSVRRSLEPAPRRFPLPTTQMEVSKDSPSPEPEAAVDLPHPSRPPA